jgi:integrase
MNGMIRGSCQFRIVRSDTFRSSASAFGFKCRFMPPGAESNQRSGLDKSRWIKWSDVDRVRKQIWVAGNEHTGTKTGEGRWMPIIPAMERLLDDLVTNSRYPRSKERKAGNFVLAVRECQKSIDRACTKLEIRRFSHHDLRHLFITSCVESGVDFLAIAKWVGHRDASLIAKTYGHLRTDHSQAMAAKVTF